MWKPHCFHVDITWFLHGHHVVSMHTTWLPCGYYVVSMCTPCGFQVDTIWFLGGHNVVSRWTTHGFQSGYYVVSTGHHMVSIWMPCGVHMNTKCCWGNHMETSTKNSSAWSQLASLFVFGLFTIGTASFLGVIWSLLVLWFHMSAQPCSIMKQPSMVQRRDKCKCICTWLFMDRWFCMTYSHIMQ